MQGNEEGPAVTGPPMEQDAAGASAEANTTAEEDASGTGTLIDYSGFSLGEEEEERRRTLCRAAGAYAHRGWRVIPVRWVDENGVCSCQRGAECGSPGKHPVHDDWPDIATNDPAEAAFWWREPPSGQAEEYWPRANIGLVTGPGSGIFVLDEDTYAGGELTLAGYERRHGDLPRTRIHYTGSGGRHYFWQYPGFPVRNSAGKVLGAGLDIRGDRGFVVAPPSVSAKGAYEITNPAHDIDPAPAPEWLLALLESHAGQQSGLGSPTLDQAPSGLVHAYVQAALDGESRTVREAPEGSRNDRLNTSAFALGTIGAHGLLDERTAFAALQDAALAAGLSPGEIGPTFRSGWSAGLASPREIHLNEIADPATSFSLDEIGLGQRLVHHSGAVLRWVDGWEEWRLYSAGAWRTRSQTEPERRALAMIVAMEATEAPAWDDTPQIGSDDKIVLNKDGDPVSPRSIFLEWVRRQRAWSKVQAAVKMGRTMPRMLALPEHFDADPMVMGFANGALDLRTGELRPHSPDEMLTMASPVSYSPDADQTPWLAYLEEVQPDPEMRGYLQRLSGYCLTGSIQEQAAILHWGTGANGKSVWLEVLAHVMGDYAQVVPASTLLAKPISHIPNDIARMRGRRFLQISETPAGKRLDEEVLKGLTGGELITARFMRGEFFDFKPTGKINLVTNHLPHLSGSHAIWRRLHMLPWEVTIPAERQDRDLSRRLIAESAMGVAAWAVEGCLAWQRQGLCPPLRALDTKQQYREQEDILGQFVQDCIDIKHDTAGVVAGRSMPELFERWRYWCQSNGYREVGTQRTLCNRLKEKGYTYDNHDHKRRGFPQLQVRVDVT